MARKRTSKIAQGKNVPTASIDEQIAKLERKKSRARTFSEKQRLDTQITELKAKKLQRREDPRKYGQRPLGNFNILNQNKQINREEKLKDPNSMVTYQTGFEDSMRRKIRGENKMITPEEREAYKLRKANAIKKANTRRDEITFPYKDLPQEPDRKRLEANLLNVSENQRIGGTKPEDAEMNAIEQLVSKIVGRNVRFMEDIPDDDPEFGQGDGGIEYPAGRPDLRMGGMTARSGATTKFKRPLGMKGGGAISSAERKRIARIVQDYKQKKARKSNGKRTNR